MSEGADSELWLSPAVAAVSQARLSVVEDFERSERARRNRLRPSTVKAYSFEWAVFASYCAGAQIDPLPASVTIVSAYVGSCIGRRDAISTLRKKLAAIRWKHHENGFASPTDHPSIAHAVDGALDELVRVPRRADALVYEDLATAAGLLEQDARGERARLEVDFAGACALARSGGAGLSVAGRRALLRWQVAVRDRALLLFGFGGGFRRGELAALNVVDLDRRDARMIAVWIALAKNLRRGNVAQKVVPRLKGDPLCPCAALDAWLDARGPVRSEVFVSLSFVGGPDARRERMCGEDVARRVQRVCARAGLEGYYRAHSLRAGFDTSGHEVGASDVDIGAVSLQTPGTVHGYIRSRETFARHPLHAIARRHRERAEA